MPYLKLDPSIAEPAPALVFGAPETATDHPGGKSLLALRSRLKVELGARTDIPDTLYNEWINDGYQDIYGSLDLPEAKRSFNLDTVENQPLYLLPIGVESIRSVSIVDPDDNTLGASFEKIDSVMYRKLPPSCGAPEYWFREQNMIVFWSTPDQVYTLTVDATLRPAILREDTDYPILDDRWHELVFKAAKTRAWEAVQNDTKSALVENSLVRQVQRQRDKDVRDEENEYPRMRVVRRASDIMSIRPRPLVVEPGE